MAEITSRRDFLKETGLLATLLSLKPLEALANIEKKSKKPNVVFILADDMGWMDSSLYGSKYYKTPNLVRLAKRGVYFTDAYAANPTCSPTRASLLTGKYPSRPSIGITLPFCHTPLHMPMKEVEQFSVFPEKAEPGLKMVVPGTKIFLPLEEYTFGEAFKDAGYKTGMIGKWHLGTSKEHWAANQGFDVDEGSPNSSPPNWFSPYGLVNFPDGPEGEYATDGVTKESLKFIEENKDRPFMLCAWTFAVHAPYKAKKEITEKYTNTKDPSGKQNCPIMASMLQSLDESVGKILDKLDELKLSDNTIIIFMSDNGGNMYDTINGTTPTNNAPLRGGKASTYEGGTRVPCMVVWPGVVKPNSKSDQVISSIDFYPTMLEMAGIKKNPEQVFDGVSFVPVLKGRNTLNREAIFCHYPHYIPATQNLPSTYVRKGDWKLIRFYGEGPDRSNAYELYNLKNDIGERNNLAEKYPEKVKELDSLIDKFILETGTLIPKKNPAYQPPITGWQASESAILTEKGQTLFLKSSGSAPYIYTTDLPSVGYEMSIKFRMRSKLKGKLAFNYTDSKIKEFSSEKMQQIDIIQDDKWHLYAFDFIPNEVLTALRIYPGQGEGEVQFQSIELSRKYGETLKKWTFKKGK